MQQCSQKDCRKGVVVMGEVKNYCHELKYAISGADYLAMRTRLKAVMSSDPHVDSNGRYQIRSVYFDNSDDK